MRSFLKELSIYLIPVLITLHVLLFYAMPLKLFVSVCFAFAILYWFVKWKNSLLISVSLVIVTLVFSVTLKITKLNQSMYYRPQEMFTYYDDVRGHYSYQPGVKFKMQLPHGDLKAMAYSRPIPLEQREVVFQTDSFGYRNLKDYSGQKYLFVGDSFIAGNGLTQNQLLTSQLRNQYGIDVYNLGHPGGMKDYSLYVQSFSKKYGEDFKVILFLFEGNDFPDHKTHEPLDNNKAVTKESSSAKIKDSVLQGIWRYSKFARDTDTYRFIYSATRKISAGEQVTESVVLKDVGDSKMAFYGPYVDVTKNTAMPVNPLTEKFFNTMSQKVAHIIFIPTKYRVYHKFIKHDNVSQQEILPDKQWEYAKQIGEKYGIQATNLTPELIKESELLLKQGEFTFWKGDTHWNMHGIAVAARVISEKIFH